MKFPNVTAQVPKDEHFDGSAVNEGIWLSAGHVNNVENALATSAANNTTQQARIDELTNQLTAANTSLSDAQTNLQTANTKIGDLQTEVKTLKEQPAGAIAQTGKEGTDESGNGTKHVHSVTKQANELRALQGKKPIV